MPNTVRAKLQRKKKSSYWVVLGVDSDGRKPLYDTIDSDLCRMTVAFLRCDTFCVYRIDVV